MEGPHVRASVSIARFPILPAQALDIQVNRALREMSPAPLVTLSFWIFPAEDPDTVEKDQ